MHTKVNPPTLVPTYCCDSDSLINLYDASLLVKMRDMVKIGRIKIPEGVFREIHRYTDRLAKTLQSWEDKYQLVVKLDYKALEFFTEITLKYGPQFRQGDVVYKGFWKSASGRKSSDAQVVALAKARGWIAVSNDNSIHGACMKEGIVCCRWEEIGRLLLKPQHPDESIRPYLPGF